MMRGKTVRQTPTNDLPPRIAPLAAEEMGPEALDIARQIRENFKLPQNGSIPAAVATMLRHPDFYRAKIAFTGQWLRTTSLDRRDMEIAILRTAHHCNSVYGWYEHLSMAKGVGVTDEEIERLSQDAFAAGWSERDRAIVLAADELHDDAMLSDATWDILARYFDEKQLIELICVIGMYHENLFLYNSLRTHLISGNRARAEGTGPGEQE